jgi:hypothetical protein
MPQSVSTNRTLRLCKTICCTGISIFIIIIIISLSIAVRAWVQYMTVEHRRVEYTTVAYGRVRHPTAEYARVPHGYNT